MSLIFAMENYAMNNREWFRQAGFGMMSHFGLYSVLDGDYKGQPCDEWVRRHQRIPMEEYHALAKAFDPIYFNADEWVKLIKDAGMKYMVFTSKHHEGFSMYRSRVSSFNVVDATPFKRDIVDELANSCAKHGIKLGLYYSQDLDWDEKDAGGFIENEFYKECHNTWDFPQNREIDFQKYLDEKAMPQVEEILTQYGDLCLIWFDCPWTMANEQSQAFYELAKKHQPECLVGGRLGNDIGDYGSGADNDINMQSKAELNESPITINDHWNFSVYDDNYKSPAEIHEIRKRLNANGVNLLLNIGPDHLGRLPGKAIEILKKL